MPFKTKYDLATKMQVCNYYVVKGGNSISASKHTGVPAQTIRTWTKTAWWEEMVREIRKRHQDRLDGKFTAIIDRLHEQLVDRIANGDEVYDLKRGEMVRRAMSGKDLSTVMDKIIEKRALMRGDPTSRTANLSVEKKMEDLQKRLEKRTLDQRKQVEESENVEELKVNEQ